MNATTTKRDVLNFDIGLAYQIALKYPTGKAISNGRIMFSTTDGEVFFCDQEDADKIYELQLRPQETFKVIRQRNGLTVERIPKVQEPVSSPPAPAAAVRTEVATFPAGTTTEKSQAHGNTLSGIMASSYIAAMDALMVAKDYAETKGLPFKISTMELRSCALSIFIACTKNGVRS